MHCHCKPIPMKFPAHLASAIPFLVMGNYPYALGCILPDLSWVPNEISFRKSGFRNWGVWILYRTERSLVPYRLCHSFLAPLLIAYFSRGLAVGWLIHLLLDAPTHRGRMALMPIYPLSKWQIPKRWTIWSNT